MSQPSLPSEDTGRMEALAWMLLALLCSRVVSLYCFYLYDDAFITFRYAANLAAGNGFVYNLGERVQGITTPLWGLLLAVVDRAGFRMEPISRGLSILCETGVAAMLITRLTREKLPRAALLAGFLFALDLYLAKAAVGGMESSLFLLLTVAAALACLAGRDALAAALAEDVGVRAARRSAVRALPVAVYDDRTPPGAVAGGAARNRHNSLRRCAAIRLLRRPHPAIGAGQAGTDAGTGVGFQPGPVSPS